MNHGKSTRGRPVPAEEPISRRSRNSGRIGTETSPPVGGTPTMHVVPPAQVASNAWRTVSGFPITSNAWSTPPSVSSTIASTGSTAAPFTVSVAPNSRANASFESCTSTAMMRDAPAMTAPWIAFSPTPPQPQTAPVDPSVTCAVLTTAPTPVTTAQPSEARRSIGTSSGTFTRVHSGATVCCAKVARLW